MSALPRAFTVRAALVDPPAPLLGECSPLVMRTVLALAFMKLATDLADIPPYSGI